MRLEGRVAVVTGSGTGIGEAIAKCFAREGASVVIDYIQEEAGQETQQAIARAGGKAIAVKANVAKSADVQHLIQETVQHFGKLDIFVNNAGIEEKHSFLEYPEELWDKIIDVDLKGPWLCSQAAARQMVQQGKGGRIINISSVHEDLPMPTNAPYCAAKGGLRMLMRTIADELAPHKITVNNIAPGAIDTPLDADIKKDPEKMKKLLAEIPLDRMGQPDEVAGLALYLASDEAAYCTGHTYFIDGGMMRHAGSL